MLKLPDKEPRGGYSRDDFNRLIEEVRKQAGMSAQYPLEMVSTPSGPMIRLLDGEFFAVLLACSTTSSSSSSGCGQQPCANGPAYCWSEVQTSGNGQFVIFQGARTSGTVDPLTNIPLQPAYEINGACLVPGTIVRLRRGYSSEYLIDHCCSVTPPFVACSSSSSSSVPSSGSSGGSSVPGSSAGSSAGSSSAVGSSTSSARSSSSSATSQGSSSAGGSLCIPFVSMVSCGGSSGSSSAGGGSLFVTLQYLNIPAGLGITVSSTPCTTGSGGGGA